MSLFKIFSRQAGSKPKGVAVPVGKYPLPEARFAELVFFAEDREIRPRLSVTLPIKNGFGVEIAPMLPTFASVLKEKGIGRVTGLGTSRDRELYRGSPGSFVIAPWQSPPFLDASLDFVLCRIPFLKGGSHRVLQEMGRILKPGRIGIVSDLHPFSPMMQEDHFGKAAGEEGLGPGFERYFKFLREGGLALTSVHEVFFDGSLKKFFQSEPKVFDRLRRHPFMIFFTVLKEGRK